MARRASRRDWGRAARAEGGGSARRLDEGREGAGPRGSQTAGQAAASPRRQGSVCQVPRRARAAEALRARTGPFGDAPRRWAATSEARLGLSWAPGALGRESSARGPAEPRESEAARPPRPTHQLRSRTRGAPPSAAGYATPTPTHATPTARSTNTQVRPPAAAARAESTPGWKSWQRSRSGASPPHHARPRRPREESGDPSPCLWDTQAFGCPRALPRPWEGRRTALSFSLLPPLFSFPFLFLSFLLFFSFFITSVPPMR